MGSERSVSSGHGTQGDQLETMARELAELRAKVQELETRPSPGTRRRVRAGTAPEPARGSERASGTPPGAANRYPVSRRRLFGLLGGAAAAGAAFSVAGATLEAHPAGADDGSNLVIGQSNSNTSNPTILTGATVGSGMPLFEVRLSSSTAASTRAVSGLHTGSDNVAAGVLGDHSGSGAGSAGVTGGSSGSANDGVGVHGLRNSLTAGGAGVLGEGNSPGAIGLKGSSDFNAALQLVDLNQTMPPMSSAWATGSFVVSGGTLWYCRAGGTGSSSQWVPLSLPPIFAPISPAPARVYDSRPGDVPTDVQKGPLQPGEERVIDLSHGVDLTGAYAALVNLTVVDTAGGGYVTLFAADATVPDTSNINFAGGWIIANNATTLFDPTGHIKAHVGGAATDLVIDVMGLYLG
jgi:hypothetical protein